jgi:hypothetical protein
VHPALAVVPCRIVTVGGFIVREESAWSGAGSPATVIDVVTPVDARHALALVDGDEVAIELRRGDEGPPAARVGRVGAVAFGGALATLGVAFAMVAVVALGAGRRSGGARAGRGVAVGRPVARALPPPGAVAPGTGLPGPPGPACRTLTRTAVPGPARRAQGRLAGPSPMV